MRNTVNNQGVIFSTDTVCTHVQVKHTSRHTCVYLNILHVIVDHNVCIHDEQPPLNRIWTLYSVTAVTQDKQETLHKDSNKNNTVEKYNVQDTTFTYTTQQPMKPQPFMSGCSADKFEWLHKAVRYLV